MPTTPEASVAVARRLMECLQSGDAEGALALYRDDVIGWRNLDQRELVKKQIGRILRFLVGLADMRYADVRILPTPEGFVQQHTLRCRAPNGAEVAVPACFVARVENGQIARIDEYMDGAAMAPLLG
jgi:ketosteroid isomerase-like protein